MNDKHTSSTERKARLQRALDDFQRKVDAGRPPDVETFLAEHADLADELRVRLAAGRSAHGAPGRARDKAVSQEPANESPASHTTIPPSRNASAAAGAARPSAGTTPPGDTRPAPEGTIYQPSQQKPTIPPQSGRGPVGSDAADAASLPESFGRYRIKRCLGHGGMGSVYLAEDTQLDREVALKIPKFQRDDGPEFLERFNREAKAAAVLRHPNACPVYDVGEIDGVNYLSMAYIEGEPLAERIRRDGALPEADVVRIVSRLASALEEAHTEGIIHRDLKPANIMLDDDDEPIIMDFGLARRVNKDDAQLTHGGGIMGSPAYMSPEQVEGESEKMGPGCDVYSLGVIMYEMLTGTVPFRGSLGSIMGQILSKEPPPPSELRPDVDPRLEAVCLKMLSKAVEDRYPSMADVINALANLPDSAALPRPQASSAQKESTLTDEARAILSGRFPPWMVWTAVFVVIAAFGLTWALLAMTLRMNNDREEFKLNEEVQQAIAGREATVFLDGEALTSDQLNNPIPVSEGSHNVEIRSGGKILVTLPHTVPEDQTHFLVYRENGFQWFNASESGDRATVDRRVGQYLLERGGRLQILPTGQTKRTVESPGELPDGEFRVTGVSMSQNPEFDDADAAHLVGLTGLETLDLSNTAVTGEFFQNLSELKDLRVLRMNATAVRDEHLAALEPLHYLHYLSLRNTGVTEPAIARLEVALPACIISR